MFPLVFILEFSLILIEKKFCRFATARTFDGRARFKLCSIETARFELFRLQELRNAELHKQDKYRALLLRRYSEQLSEKKSCR